MHKTLLITGATDGIGLLTAKKLAAAGHHLLIHGRNPTKLKAVEKQLKESASREIYSYCADLSDLQEVESLTKAILAQHPTLDVVINNAGVYKTQQAVTKNNLDVRFVVNTLAPYLIAKRLTPPMGADGRIVNLASAAQAPVDLAALKGEYPIKDDMNAYAQSKLAIIMWSYYLASHSDEKFPVVFSVNPGSLLASKMVKEGFGVEGKDLNIGADILVRASLGDEFANASGRYFDNDSERFSSPHPDGLDAEKCKALIGVINQVLDV